VRVNPANPQRPVVRILSDGSGCPVQRMEVLDLMEKEPHGGRFARTIIGSITSPPAAPAGSAPSLPSGS